ncbi:hypothetical protein EYF80_037148 [Liparis tanakae]|uniref:Uncharacterized protein n=1 Tax=Liparis tanakae TaxID=230148 RepID=A0A4Z2GGG4_9TELE|nr:hypothetical protein EYF80_037148 [Liparis tanakae]
MAGQNLTPLAAQQWRVGVVSPVLFIYQHQIKEVAYGELLVDIPHGYEANSYRRVLLEQPNE